ncbi:type I polyketide synthase [Acidisphaera sp. S103]|uniref:type I polyketide synthase n=1 Tax=Acidisphaera sp. S103 TaxID=1747223 RepID=UPI00131CB129|nr:type I polyketide synthase [Acidisphaera sp. S103]
MLDTLIRYSHGFVAVPVIRAFVRRGVFEQCSHDSVTCTSLAKVLGANTGHLAAAIDLLASLGWLEIAPDGRLILLPGARPDAVPDDLLGAYACDWSSPGSAASDLLDRFVPLIARQWDVGGELADHLSGAIAVPLINGSACAALRAGTATGTLRDCFVALRWADRAGRPTALGTFVAERGQVTGTAASYAALLRALPEMLFGDPARVMRRDDAGQERHVDRTANVVSSGFQHGRYFADLETVLTDLLDAVDLDAQPTALVDMGCGDGTLLRRAWNVVKRCRRGQHLDTHPLLLVGVDFNAESLEATSLTLDGLPHLLMQGDIADPARLVADLTARNVDPTRVLHLRSFLDHDRPAKAPLGDWTARAADGDACTVVAPNGSLVPPGCAMQSLMEHFARWREVLGPHGLLLLEVHRLPPAVAARARDDTESPHFDAYHAFSGQQLVQSDSFVLAAAEAGLFGSSAAFRKYPRVHPFARIQLQHLRPRPWRVRPGRLADLPALLALEEACWPVEALRHDAATLRIRLGRPRGILVAEQAGAVVGALHVQRVASLDVLRGARWESLHDLHRADGPVLQLLGLMVRPEAQDRGLGDALADFALQWAALTPGVEAVAGLTRCRDWDGRGDYAAWMAARDADGLPADPTLRFHVGRGASVVGVVLGFRPADTANAGHGVLIAYDIGGGHGAASAGPDVSEVLGKVSDCVRAVMRGGADRFDPARALRDLGLDSADLLELRTLLNRRLGLRLEASFFFDHPTVTQIAAKLAQGVPTVAASTPVQVPALLPPVTVPIPPTRGEDIAVIGLACRFPGASDADAYWRLLETGVDATGPVPAERWADTGARGGFLDGVADFDPAAFSISAREARGMDPQQRLLLEVSLAALEHAGVDVEALRGSPTGVFLGLFAQDWERRLLSAGVRPDGHFATGTSNAIAAGRLAYAFGFGGPALAVNTACSSSLVAVHLAIQSLRRGESQMALAGGVSLMLMPDLTRAFADAGMLAGDGRCRPFDSAADGYARSEGVGIVVLKRLGQARADEDRVLAVLRGGAINQDGASNGLTAPSGAAQRAVIAAALDDAGLAAADVDVVEAHGTGTPLGDPIEAAALAEAYGTGRRAPLLVTAGKGNIGHTEAAAGIAGLVKCILSLRAGRVPGIAHLRAPNAAVAPLPLRLADGTQVWPGSAGRPRRMAVSAFGFSGTNAHLVVQEAPAVTPVGTDRTTVVMPLAARDVAGLRRLAAAWAAGLDDGAEPRDLCVVASRRRMLPVRGAVVGRDVATLRAGLAALAENQSLAAGVGQPRVGFLFTGQGSQYRGMGLALAAREPAFRAALDRADAVLRPLLGRSVDALLTADDLDDTGNAQPAICAVQLALLSLLEAWGVRPAVVLGHSVGEIAAAHAAGVLSFEDALRLAALRGRVMQALPAGGAMLALRADAATTDGLLSGLTREAGLAALNGPRATVVSGTAAAVATIAARAAAAEITAMPLRVSHAFHSPLMEPAMAPFAAVLEEVALQPARLPVCSTLTGDMDADLSDPDYWVRQLRAPVRFAEAMVGMRADVLLELGPQPVLCGLARAGGMAACEPTLVPDGDSLAEALAALHRHGAVLDWRAIYRGPYPDAALPATPLARQRFWVDLPGTVEVPAPVATGGVLGQRVRLPGADEARWQARLTVGMAPFFHDHRLHGRVVVPAASHIAILLTALRQLGRPAALADLIFPSPLILPDSGARLAQVVVGPSSVRLLTVAEEADPDAIWATHLEGRLEVVAGSVPPAEPVGAVRIGGDAFYAGFTAAGYTFGPAMRGLLAAEVAGDVAVGRLADAVPGELAIDPAMLDAAFQVQGVWFDTPALARDDALFVPHGVQHIVLHDPPVGRCRAIVRRRAADEPDAITRIADLWLVDASGRAVLEARGFRFRRISRAALLEGGAGQANARLLHRLDWQAVAAPTAVAPSVLVAPLSVPESGSDRLDEAAAGWAAAAFAAAGKPLIPGDALDLNAAMGRLSARGPLVADFLAALRDVGALDQAGRVLRVPALPGPADDPAAALLARTGPYLLAVAQGRADPLALLFPDGDSALAARVYAEAPDFAAMNRLAAKAVATLARPGLRVIEFGAGTGATTAALLPALPGCEYVFTDVSARFTASAASRFAGLRTAVVDLDRDVGPVDGQRFDLAVAANVLHALRDLPGALRRIAGMLRPDGMLLLLEGSAPRGWVNLTFGLLDGWRRHLEGPAPREETLLDAAAWDRVLREAGFEPAVLPSPDIGLFPQTLVLARRQVAPRWLVAGDGRLAHAMAGLGADRFSEDVVADGVLVCASDDPADALAVLQRIVALPRPPGPVWLVTQGAVAAVPGDRVATPEQAAVWGMGRVVRLEQPGLDLRLVDVEDAAQLAGYLRDPGAAVEVALRGSKRFAARVVQDGSPLGAAAWHPGVDGPWLITGGFGGLGLRLAKGLIERGARHLVLVGRHPVALDALRRDGVRIDAMRVDVADPAALTALIREVRPCGVFHLAGVLEDATLHRLDAAALRRSLAPKAVAAMQLDGLLDGDQVLVLFGSAAALLGNPGQAAHAAANAVLAAVAAGRRARGQPGLCVDWGAWAEVGTVAVRNPFRGLRPMPPQACLDALWHLMGAGVAHGAVMDVAWDELAGARVDAVAFDPSPENRREAMTAHVVGHLAAVLAVPPGQMVDPRQGFFAMGLDSLTSVELRNRLQVSLGRPLPATITFDHPNVEALVAWLLGDGEPDPVEAMDDEEALALIEREAERLGLSEAAE